MTDVVYKTWADKTAKEYKQHKGLKNENLRDNMTNKELIMSMLAELSTKERDLLKDGFHAKTLAEELKCPNIEMDVLWTIEDVTAQVEASAKPGMSNAQKSAARRAKMTELEKAVDQ